MILSPVTRCSSSRTSSLSVLVAADFHLKTSFERAALDEVFADSWFIEAACDGPDGFRRRVDSLSEQGGALVGAYEVGVVFGNERDE